MRQPIHTFSLLTCLLYISEFYGRYDCREGASFFKGGFDTILFDYIFKAAAETTKWKKKN
jgi:hypothetical protein